MAKKNILDVITGILLTIGGLNWGFVVFNWNLVEWLATLTTLTWLSTTIYSSVGLSAMWVIIRSLMSKYMK